MCWSRSWKIAFHSLGAGNLLIGVTWNRWPVFVIFQSGLLHNMKRTWCTSRKIHWECIVYHDCFRCSNDMRGTGQCSVCEAEWFRWTFPHCLCPAALLSVFILVALKFRESICSFIDTWIVEHPLFMLFFNLGILFLISVVSCWNIFLLRIWKK